MGIFRRRKPDQLPPAVDPDTLAGAHQLGRDGFSGMVPAHRAWSNTSPAAERHYLGHDQLVDTTQTDVPRTPDSLYVDRPLFGGVRAEAAHWEFWDQAPLSGAHQVIAGRPYNVTVMPAVVMPAEVEAPAESFRQPPLPQVCRRVPTSGAGQ